MTSAAHKGAEQLQIFINSLLSYRVEGESLVFWALSSSLINLNGASQYVKIIDRHFQQLTLSRQQEVHGWIPLAVITELGIVLPTSQS